MHAISLLIHLNFSSKFMVTWRHSAFGPLRTNQGVSKAIFRTLLNHVIMKSSKTRFWFISTCSNWIKTGISSRDHEFRKEIQVIKSETACMCVTWPTPSYSLLDQKLDPPGIDVYYTKEFVIEFAKTWSDFRTVFLIELPCICMYVIRLFHKRIVL